MYIKSETENIGPMMTVKDTTNKAYENPTKRKKAGPGRCK